MNIPWHQSLDFSSEGPPPHEKERTLWLRCQAKQNTTHINLKNPMDKDWGGKSELHVAFKADSGTESATVLPKVVRRVGLWSGDGQPALCGWEEANISAWVESEVAEVEKSILGLFWVFSKFNEHVLCSYYVPSRVALGNKKRSVILPKLLHSAQFNSWISAISPGFPERWNQ